MEIPFNRPYKAPRSVELIRKAFSSQHVSGNGPFTKEAESLLEKQLPGSRALLTTSCTHALEMCALLLDIGPGDEVILPSYTFVSTANAFVLRGAKPVFVDARPDTLNLDERLLEVAITGKTKAIVVVHYAGVGCEMDVIVEIAESCGIPVIEDNAHGLFGSYKGRALGTFGNLATLSFHETKNISCGEGGALIINDEALLKRAEIIREKGTNRAEFFRGHVDKYSWVDLGSSYVISDILAAVLVSQLEEAEKIQKARERSWKQYFEELSLWADENEFLILKPTADCESAWHLFALIAPTNEDRDALMDHLRTKNVSAVFHYLPLHDSDFGQQFSTPGNQCPVTREMSARILRLPLYNEIGEEEIGWVIESIKSWRK